MRHPKFKNPSFLKYNHKKSAFWALFKFMLKKSYK